MKNRPTAVVVVLVVVVGGVAAEASLTITGLNIDWRGSGLFDGKLTVRPIAPNDRRSGLEPKPSAGVAAPRVVGPVRKEGLIVPKMPELGGRYLSLIRIVGATRRGNKTCICNNKEREK